MVCKQMISYANFAVHIPRCEAKTFFNQYKPFLKFLSQVIKRHNMVIRREVKKKERNHAKDTVAACLIGVYDVPDTEVEMLELAAEKHFEKTQIKEILEQATEEGIKLSNPIPKEVIIDAMKGTEPKISFRQIVFEYLKDQGKLTKNLKYWIDNCFKNRDYPTNDELSVDLCLFKKILTIRSHSGYKDIAQRFYYMLIQYFDNPANYRCEFCFRYTLRPREHVKRCGKFVDDYNLSRESTIKKFLDLFYPKYAWDYKYYSKYYNELSPNYFLSTINEHRLDKVKFSTKILEAKQNFQKTLFEPPKWDVKEFVKEVDKDVGPDEKIPERYTIPLTYIDKEMNLLKDEEEIETPYASDNETPPPFVKEEPKEEIKFDPKYTRIKIKDPNAPSVLACQDPIIIKPKLIIDEKRGIMTFAEPPKPKQVEPSKEEEKKEKKRYFSDLNFDPEKEPLPELPDDFNLFDYDILNNKK